MVENEVGKVNESLILNEQLKFKWNNLCQRLNISDTQTFFDDIVDHYSETHRSYHTLEHVKNSLQELDPIRTSVNNPEAVELAIWYHDIIYIIGKNDNEEKSAELAKEFCHKNNLSPALTKQVEDNILATKHVLPSNDLDSQYLADIDMSILGQSVDVFDKYEEQIYKEYSTLYSKTDFQKGRADFLKTVLECPYSTEFFKNKYEKQAKQNIQRTLDKLQK